MQKSVNHNKNLNVVTKTLGPIETFDHIDLTIDPLLLTSEERSSPHMVAHTASERTVNISLPRGITLEEGEVVLIDEAYAVVVHAAPEDLFVVKTTGTINWAIAGFQLGNFHRPVRFTEDAILTPADPMVADMLQRLEISFEHKVIPFSGKRVGAWGGHNHEH